LKKQIIKKNGVKKVVPKIIPVTVFLTVSTCPVIVCAVDCVGGFEAGCVTGLGAVGAGFTFTVVVLAPAAATVFVPAALVAAPAATVLDAYFA